MDVGGAAGSRKGAAPRVLIIDDHKLFAEALRAALERRSIKVVGIATNEDEALSLAGAERPVLVLVDLGLPGTSGVAVGRRILRELPDTRVLAVTALRGQAHVREALDAGFQGYLTKDTPVAEFADSIRAALRGDFVLSPSITEQGDPGIPRRPERSSLADRLTRRERQVLALLAAGAGTREVASRLSISPNTVRTHVQSILTKLQAHSRLEAVALGIRHGIIDPAGRHEGQP